MTSYQARILAQLVLGTLEHLRHLAATSTLVPTYFLCTTVKDKVRGQTISTGQSHRCMHGSGREFLAYIYTSTIPCTPGQPPSRRPFSSSLVYQVDEH